MKTLLLAPELFASASGIARILRLYLKALCELAGQGDHVQFVALNDSRVEPAELARYSSGQLSEGRSFGGRKVAYSIAALRLGVGADRIVCGHVAQLPLAWAASLLSPGTRYFLVAHGIEVWRPFTFLEKRALLGARRIWCVSEFTRAELLKRCPGVQGRTAVLANALDPFLEPAEPLSPPDEPPLILSISRLSIADNYKGIGHLIAAMPAIAAAVPGTRLRIVGKGDALAGLQELARSLGVAECVEFAGFVADSQLRSEFARCRLFALPSEKEGFGLVYIEAMAHGRPCLAARSAGAPEVVTSETGVLVDYGDVVGIAEAAISALGRSWPTRPLLERAWAFSYLRFRERLASIILE